MLLLSTCVSMPVTISSLWKSYLLGKKNKLNGVWILGVIPGRFVRTAQSLCVLHSGTSKNTCSYASVLVALA
jgi:hypothetical protein